MTQVINKIAPPGGDKAHRNLPGQRTGQAPRRGYRELHQDERDTGEVSGTEGR